MAEFREVMTRFARLCDYYSQSSCHGCPVDEEGFNCACEKQGCSKSSAEELEAIIMKWAADHPEPVYPTFVDWLIEKGVIPQKGCMLATTHDPDTGEITEARIGITPSALQPIPADIAEKLGIEPKEIIFGFRRLDAKSCPV